MLKLKGRAALMAISPRKEFHGDTEVKAVTLRLDFTSVPLDVIEAGFVSQLSLLYSEDDDVQLSDLEALRVSRHVANVIAKVDTVTMKRMVVDHVRLTLLPKRLVGVVLKLKGPINEGLDELHELLFNEVTVSLEEKEFVADQPAPSGPSLSLVS